MKRLLSFLFALAVAGAAPAVTLIGTAQYPGGQPVLQGTILLYISQDVTVNSGPCGGPALIVISQPQTVAIVNGTPAAGNNVTGNDCVSPANTYYIVTINDSFGTTVLHNNYSITGTTVDIGTWTPLVVTGGTITPTTNMSGDVTGAVNSNTVVRMQGNPISGTSPSSGQTLQFLGGVWTPANPAGGGTVTNIATTAPLTGGPITGTGTLAISNCTATTAGAVPSPGGASGRFLNDSCGWQTAVGTGTVTNVATGTGLTGGPISGTGTISLVTPVAPVNGGLGLSIVAQTGFPFFSSGSQSFLSGSALTTAHGGTGVNGGASTAFFHETTGTGDLISDPLPLANGGLGVTSGVSGGIPYFSSSSTTASTTQLKQFAVVYGNGAGTPPSTTNIPNADQVLVEPHSGATAPVFGQVDLSTSAAIKNNLGYSNGGTATGVTFTQNSVIFAGLSSFTQDNSNFFYDSGNKTLGVSSTETNPVPAGLLAPVFDYGGQVFNVKAYGAYGDTVYPVRSLTTTNSSASITASGATFGPNCSSPGAGNDCGKTISIQNGANGTSSTFVGLISTVTGSTTATLNNPVCSTCGASGLGFFYGHDDTSAIQAVITNQLNATGGIVYFPPGAYLITATLTAGTGASPWTTASSRNGITLLGSSDAENTISYATTPSFAIGFTGYGKSKIVWAGSDAGTMVSLNGVLYNSNVRNLHLDGTNEQNKASVGGGNKGSAGILLDINSCDYCEFSNLNLTGFNKTGMIVEGTPGDTPSPLGGTYNWFNNIDVETSNKTLGITGVRVGGLDGTNGNHLFGDAHQIAFNNLVVYICGNDNTPNACTVSDATAVAIDLQFIDSSTFTHTTIFQADNTGIGIRAKAPVNTSMFPEEISFYHVMGKPGSSWASANGWGPQNGNGIHIYGLDTGDSGTIPTPVANFHAITDTGACSGDFCQSRGTQVSTDSDASNNCATEFAFQRGGSGCPWTGGTIIGANIPEFVSGYTVGQFQVLGTVLRVKAGGLYSTTGTPALTLNVKLNTTGGNALCTFPYAVAAAGAANVVTGASNAPWEIQCEVSVRSYANPTATLQRGFSFSNANTPANQASCTPCTTSIPSSVTGTTTVTASGTIGVNNQIVVTALWGTASASNTIKMTHYNVEVVYPGSTQ